MSNQPGLVWDRLDPAGPPEVAWVREPGSRRVVLLLGAFDPPTNAHLALVRAGARVADAAGVLCLTKTLLARPVDGCLPVAARLDLLEGLAAEHGFGLAFANRGTYIDVADALRASGFDATFVVGSDKLAQLSDPSFYADGERGVARTFAEVRFLVVPRPDRSGDRPELSWVEPDDVFSGPDERSLSATEVRRRLRDGEKVDHLVPRAVALALEGYTSAK